MLNLAPSGHPSAVTLADPTTFARLFNEHHRSVYAAAYRVLGDSTQAHDVVQDVFLRLWRKPEKYDARRGELGTYLRLMARSRALDLWREGQAAGRATDRLRLVVDRSGPRAEERTAEVVERGLDGELVRRALHALPAGQREAIVLAYWGGLTAEEIARRAGVPLGTAKSRIRLGLAKLREAVTEDLEPQPLAAAA